MNKTLLFLSALALCGSSVSAQAVELSPMSKSAPAAVQAKADLAPGQMEFRYYVEGDIEGLRANGLYSGDVKEAIIMPAATAATYAGNKIVALNITTPPNASGTATNYVKAATIFLSYGKDEEPFYTQEVSLGIVARKQVTVTLDTPYEITGDKDICFGYSFSLNRNIANQMYYIAVDNVPTDNENGAWVELGGAWQPTNKMGSLLIGAILEGDSLPMNLAGISGVDGVNYTRKDRNYDFTVNVSNTGANEIKDVTFEYGFGEDLTTTTYTFEPALAVSGAATAKLTAVCKEEGANIPMSVKITKVNGVDNKSDANSAVINVNSFVNIFKRNVVIEEGTGTWCPNCPLGIITLEDVAKKYTDGSVILIGVHNSDKMAVSAYQGILDYMSGLPGFVVNRMDAGGFYQNRAYNAQMMDAYIKSYQDAPARGKIDLYLEWTSDERTKIHAEVQSLFSLPQTGTYRVAFAVVENGVGPYAQASNISGVAGFEPFTGAGNYVSWVYDDVARGIYNLYGLNASAMTDPEAMTYYNYSYEVPLTNVQNIDKTSIVAMLLDNQTREIINAVQVPLLNASGVDDVIGDEAAVSVRAEMGAVVVNGAAVTEVYTIDGRRAATAYGEATINLPSGLYIVKADKVVKKVIVR